VIRFLPKRWFLAVNPDDLLLKRQTCTYILEGLPPWEAFLIITGLLKPPILYVGEFVCISYE
jgi:hypothetical protein